VDVLGYLGGETFRDDRWKALAASLALAGVIAVAAESSARAVAERVGRLTLRPAPRWSIMHGGWRETPPARYDKRP
jgi:hypothetical protein